MKKLTKLQKVALVKFVIVLLSMTVSYFLTYYAFRSENIWTMIVIASVLAAILEGAYLKTVGKKD